MAEMTFYVGMPDAEMHAILEARKKSRLAARTDKVVVTDTFAPRGRQPTYLPTGGRPSRRPQLTYLPTLPVWFRCELVTSKKDQTQTLDPHAGSDTGRAGRADIREGQHTLGVCQN